MTRSWRARSGIGFVPQGREIFARLTVEENMRMGLAYKPASTPIPPELYELFPVLKQMLKRRGGDLSGGQQQQLAIAFTAEQRSWLDHLAEHIATSLAIDPDEFQDGWFGQQGGYGRAFKVFGDRLQSLLVELNERLAA